MKNKKPKIAILVPRYGLVDRGVEVFAKELTAHLIKDFEVIIYSRLKTTKETKKVMAVPESNKLINWFYRLNEGLRKQLDKYHLNPIEIEMLTFSIFAFPKLLFGNFDLIFPQNGIWGAVICRLVRAIKKTPFIYHSAGGKEPLIAKQNPNLYIALNPEVDDWLKKYFPKLKTILIPYGVDLKKFSLEVKPARMNLEKPIFLCAGALIPTKRIDLAVKAVSRLKKGSLLVVGDGPLKAKINQLGRKLLGSKRFLIKRAAYEKMPQFYSAADVFTLPSLDEPFGIVYLEALASGLPVVAPDDESRRYIIGPAGILCEVENLKEYTGALRKAAQVNFSARAIKQAKRFDWQKVGKKYKKKIVSLTKAQSKLRLQKPKIAGDYQYRALTKGLKVQRFWHQSKIEFLKMMGKFSSQDVVLDAGCGSGNISFYLAKKVRKVIGLDANQEAIVFAQSQTKQKKLTNTVFKRANLKKIAFKDSYFTRVILFEVVEHLNEKDYSKIFAEIHRVMKPGGLLYLTVPNQRSLWPLIELVLETFHLVPSLKEQHLFRFNFSFISQMVTQSRFRLKNHGTMNHLSPFVSFLSWRLAKKLFCFEVMHFKKSGPLIWLIAEK